ncbi:WxL domain-containing protein [Enterococcus faecalis]|nr:WxL domain-containing protein [Enterococcus faecalis]EGO8411681.1 WxL domain-containing protein [Enterococcus faecalis]EJI7151599.1 WxL domain-containing protein [Enterococcus faecalis]ELT8933504.1 WxL domain-containing protein [Enterococcus faecalis]NSP04113.1 WxL domain-containing protein [Enterococcus faecalis]
MKKKIMASLLVGSAVVGASLAPLSAQAVTTGNTPVQVEFDGGVLPDQGDNTGGSVDPDPTKPNTDFDLLAIPRSFDFSPVKIGEDLTSIKSVSPPTSPRSVMVGDLRGTKEGWHVTGEITEMKNGIDKLDGQFKFGMTPYYAVFNVSSGLYGGMASQNGMNITDDPTAPSFIGTNITIGGAATTIMNATGGKGQGTWLGRIDNMTLNVTTPYQQIKAGNYTGDITWNLVAGPSI